MTASMFALFSLVVLATSFISGIFGMAGGMILMGILLFLVPVPTAMILHGITQMASNGWRAALWSQHIRWSIVGRYGLGLVAASALFATIQFIPDERFVMIALGLIPFIALAMPAHIVPQVTRPFGAELCGFICTSFQLLSGISGPTLDTFFVRSLMDRRLVVATKAASQTITHLTKLIYFGFIIGNASDGSIEPVVAVVAVALAVIGTTLSRSILDRLTDRSFQKYTQWIVAAIGLVYLYRGVTAFF